MCIRDSLRTVAPGLEIQPVDATMQLRNGTPALVAARPGRLIDGPTSAETVSRGLVDGSRTAQLTLLDVAPALTSEQVAGYGITAEIGRATVTIGGAGEPARLSNAALAAKKLTGRLVAPGGQVSFNQSVGPRTPAAGFAATTTRLPGVGTEDEGGVGPVSYTHLDVYKRQAWDRPRPPPRGPCPRSRIGRGSSASR